MSFWLTLTIMVFLAGRVALGAGTSAGSAPSSSPPASSTPGGGLTNTSTIQNPGTGGGGKTGSTGGSGGSALTGDPGSFPVTTFIPSGGAKVGTGGQGGSGGSALTGDPGSFPVTTFIPPTGTSSGACSGGASVCYNYHNLMLQRCCLEGRTFEACTGRSGTAACERNAFTPILEGDEATRVEACCFDSAGTPVRSCVQVLPCMPDPNRVPQVPNVSISKTVDRSSINAGERAIFTIDVTNIGYAPASNVVVTDNLPVGFTLTERAKIDVDPNTRSPEGDLFCTDHDNVVTCTIPSLAANDGNTTGPEPDVARITIRVQSSRDSCGALTNEASVRAPGDTFPDNDRSSATVAVHCQCEDQSLAYNALYERASRRDPAVTTALLNDALLARTCCLAEGAGAHPPECRCAHTLVGSPDRMCCQVGVDMANTEVLNCCKTHVGEFASRGISNPPADGLTASCIRPTGCTGPGCGPAPDMTIRCEDITSDPSARQCCIDHQEAIRRATSATELNAAVREIYRRCGSTQELCTDVVNASSASAFQTTPQQLMACCLAIRNTATGGNPGNACNFRPQIVVNPSVDTSTVPSSNTTNNTNTTTPNTANSGQPDVSPVLTGSCDTTLDDSFSPAVSLAAMKITVKPPTRSDGTRSSMTAVSNMVLSQTSGDRYSANPNQQNTSEPVTRAMILASATPDPSLSEHNWTLYVPRPKTLSQNNVDANFTAEARSLDGALLWKADCIGHVPLQASGGKSPGGCSLLTAGSSETVIARNVLLSFGSLLFVSMILVVRRQVIQRAKKKGRKITKSLNKNDHFY